MKEKYTYESTCRDVRSPLLNSMCSVPSRVVIGLLPCGFYDSFQKK